MWLALGTHGSGFHLSFPVLAGNQEDPRPGGRRQVWGDTAGSALVMERRTAGPLHVEPWTGVRSPPYPGRPWPCR